MIFNTCEGQRKFFGSIVTISADNLGSHSVGGFKEGFSALRPCRQCMTTNREMKQNVSLLNTYVTHNMHNNIDSSMSVILSFGILKITRECVTILKH